MYKLYKNSFGTENVMKTNEDGTIVSFPQNTESADYQAYLKWLEEGNEPLPADEGTQ